MNFHESNSKIWLQTPEGKITAYVEFPEFAPGKVEVTHTVVAPELQGQGIAGQLMKELVNNLRRTGRKAELTCSYAVRWFAKHDDAHDVLIAH